MLQKDWKWIYHRAPCIIENKGNKVVKHTLNPDAEEYAPTTNVGPIRKDKDTALNRIVGISMEEEEVM